MVNFLHLLAIVNSKQVQHVNEQATTAGQVIASDQPAQSASKVRHALWAVGGFLCFALGMVGVVLPILPTTPFILVAAFCFARSSTRLNSWFKGTKVYKQVLEGYVTKRSMTLRAKLTILIPVTVLRPRRAGCPGGGLDRPHHLLRFHSENRQAGIRDFALAAGRMRPWSSGLLA